MAFKYRMLFEKRHLQEWTQKAIENGELYFPKARELNDPFDFDYSVEILRYYRLARSGSIDAFRNSFGILSTSLKNDDILMWSHYEDYHRGVCLGYNASTMIAKILSTFSGILFVGHVVYSPLRPNGSFLRWLPSFASPAFCVQTYLMTCLFTKYSEWSYEDEFRFALLPYSFQDERWRRIVFKPEEITFGCSSDVKKALSDLKARSVSAPYRIFERDDFDYSLNLIVKSVV